MDMRLLEYFPIIETTELGNVLFRNWVLSDKNEIQIGPLFHDSI